MTKLVAVLGVGVACVLQACSPFAGFHGNEAPHDDAGVDAGAGIGTHVDAELGTCTHARVPTRPAQFAVVSDSEAKHTFTVGVQRVDLGDGLDTPSPAWESIGYDLDGFCTASGKHDSCARPSWAIASSDDGSDGRDNAIGSMLYGVNAAANSSSSDAVNQGTASGFGTMVIRVSNYNGQPADPHVTVAVYGVMRPRKLQGTDHVAPIWDGTDEWVADAEWYDASALGGDDPAPPVYVDNDAFVSGSQLVAHYAALHVRTGTLRPGTVAASIVRSGSGWKLVDGVIAGRESLDDLLASIEDPISGDPVCIGAPNYDLIKRNLCSYADIAVNGPDDGKTPCDGVTWAWRFQTEPALLTGVDPSRSFNLRCPVGMSPSTDRCTTLSATK